MYILAADITDPVTLGLGVIAAALFFGEFAFFKWIHGPALDRADKHLTAAEERHKEEMLDARKTILRLEDKIDRQNLILEEKALPALISASATASEIRQLVISLRAEQDDLTRERELEEARRQALRDRRVES